MKNIWPLLLLLTMASSAMAETRGLTELTVFDPTGQSIDLYQGSYALLIGASDYQDPKWPDIGSIPRELDNVERILKAQGFSVEKHLDPTKREMQNQFEDFVDKYGYDQGNRLLFFYAGHGYTRKDGNKGYLVPVDAPSPLENEKEFLRKALSMDRILTWARESEAKHSLFLFDSCFSGTIFKSRALPDHPPAISSAVSLPVRQFITAGSAGEPVPAQSTFTPAFIDALEHGSGDLNEDGYVSGTELGLYLQQEVPKYVNQTPQFGKINDYELSRGDFVFVLPGVRLAKAPSDTELRPLAGNADNSLITVDAKVLELEFWQSIKDSNNPDMYRAHLEQFPGGAFARLAKQKLLDLEEQKRNAELAKQQQGVQRQQQQTDQAPGITGLWIDKHKCHVSITRNATGELTGAAWGTSGGSMQVTLAPVPNYDRRFAWKARMRTIFDSSLKRPRNQGKFTIDLYDNAKLHTTYSLCARGAGQNKAIFRRASSLSAYRVEPPKWYVAIAE